MQVFYVDEAGCTGTLASAVSPIQPVFVVGGVMLHQARLQDFTLDWLHLKDRFFPNQDANQWWRGGITVRDGIGHQTGGVLFGP